MADDGDTAADARVRRLLRELRSAAGLTPEAVATQLGCAPNDVADIEAGRADVPAELWPVLAEMFDVPPKVFLREAFAAETATYADLVDAVDRHASPRVRRAVQNMVAALATGGEPR